MNARDLRNKKAGLVVEAQSILDKAEKESRALATEEREKYDGLLAQVQEIDGDIRRVNALGEMRESGGRLTQPENPEIGMSAEETRQYSLLKAINAAVTNNWRGAGLELEASQAVQKKFGREPRSFFVPYDVLKRDLVVGTPSAGGYLKGTQLLAGSFVEMLRNRMAVTGAGATMLTGLVGDIAIPKQTASATGYWLAESGAPTESQQTLGQIALTPHTFGAFTDISRKLLKQSSIDVENFVMADIAQVIALGVDYAALHGNSGSDANQPDGIAVTSGIGSVVGGTNGAAPDWADIVDLETEVAVDNADLGRLAYMTNAKVRGRLKKTLRTATYGDIPVWGEGAQPLNGYQAIVTNQVSSTLTKGTSSVASAIFFGNWADLILAYWGDGLDMLVDPYTGSTSGTVRVVAFQDVDVAVRHAQSFAAMLDALTA